MLKLDKITFRTIPAIPGIRAGDLSSLDCNNPAGPLDGWRVVLQGKAMFLVSPPGWTPATATTPHQRKKNGPVVIHEIPRDNVFLHWSADEEDTKAVFVGKAHEQRIGKPVVEEPLTMIPPPA